MARIINRGFTALVLLINLLHGKCHRKQNRNFASVHVLVFSLFNILYCLVMCNSIVIHFLHVCTSTWLFGSSISFE